MALAVRRCYKKLPGSGNWAVGKMCNKKGAKKKYASGVRTVARKPPLKRAVKRTVMVKKGKRKPRKK